MMDYWDECIKIAFEDAGITATAEQINSVVEAVKGGRENYSIYTGEHTIEHPAVSEAKALKIELAKEKDKRVCNKCWGRGTLTSSGGTFYSTSQCWMCNGEGYL